MKISKSAAVILCGMCLCSSVFAEIRLDADRQNCIYWENCDRSYILRFDRAMVPPDQVGKPVRSGLLVIEPNVDYKAVWLTSNSMEINFPKGLPFRKEVKMSLSKDATYADGTKEGLNFNKALGVYQILPVLVTNQKGESNQYESINTKEPLYIFLGQDAPEITKSHIEKSIYAGCWVNASSFIFDLKRLKISDIKNNPDLLQVYKEMLPSLGLSEEEFDNMPLQSNTTCYRLDISENDDLYGDYNLRLAIPNMGAYSETNKKYADRYVQLGRGIPYQFNTDVDREGDQDVYRLSWAIPIQIKDINQYAKNNLELRLQRSKKTLVFDDKKNIFVGKVKDAKTNKMINVEVSCSLTKDDKLNNEKGIRSLSFKVKPESLMEELYLTSKQRVNSFTESLRESYNTWKLNLLIPDAGINLGNNGVMSKGSKSVRSSVVGIDKITYRVIRIKPSTNDSKAYDALAYNLYEQDYSPYDYGNEKDKKILASIEDLTIGEQFEFIKTPESKGESSKYETIELTLDDLVGGSAPKGMYFIDVQNSFSPQSQQSVDFYGMDDLESRPQTGTQAKGIVSQSLVQLTDLGLLAKITGTNGFFYAYSLNTALPLKNAQLSFINKEGDVLSTEKMTDGTCMVTLPKGGVYVRCTELSDQGQVVDQYLMPIVNDAGSVYAGSNIETVGGAWESIGLNPNEWAIPKVLMFSDRELYRPSETMHLKGIVRDLKDNKILLPKAESVDISIIDDQSNTEIWKETLPIDKNGAFNFNYTFPSSKVGSYGVQAKLNGVEVPDLSKYKSGEDNEWFQKNLISSMTQFDHHVSVQEFKRNEFEIKPKLVLGKPGDKTLELTASAINFSGVPVSNGEVRWYKQERATNFYPKNYKDYFFGDHTSTDYGYWRTYYGYSNGYWGSSNDAMLEGVLDLDGKITKKWKIDDDNPLKIKNIKVDTFVTNLNKQRLKASDRGVYYPSNVFVGIKSDDVIAGQNTKFDLSLVGITPEEKVYTKGDLPLKVKVKHQAFETTRGVNENGSYVDSTPVWTQVAEQDIVLTPQDSKDPNKVDYSFTAEQPGIYDIEVSGKDEEGNPFASTIRRWVYGDGQSPWEYRDGLGLDIVTDKKMYLPGETAKLLLMTPIDAELVVTVERNGVLKSYNRKVTVDNPIIEVPIEEGYAPNVYVSAFLVKGADFNKRAVKNPQLKLGYTCLNVSVDHKKLLVSLEPPTETTKPGEKITVKGVIKDIKGNTVPNANVCLYAVDDGTLQVSGYDLPKPLNRFYSTIPLGVNTWTTLGQLLTEDPSLVSFTNKGVFIGGGGEGAMKSSPLDMKIRTDFNPLAVWLANIETDANGQFKAEYVNPDLLTRYRVMAVASAGQDQFGSGESSYTVNKQIMLEPAPPMMASTGDKLNIPVTISQTIDRQGLWEVRLKGSDTVSVSDAVQYVELTGKEPKSLEFNVNMKSKGEAKLEWFIQPVNADKQVIVNGPEASYVDAVESKFGIVLPLPELREQYSFTLNGSEPVKFDQIFKYPFVAGATVEWSLCTSPFMYCNGSFEYLLTYPYGCLEQLSSCLVPWLYEPELKVYLPGFSKATNTLSRDKCINDGIGKILNNQLSDGGLSYWPKGDEASEYTPYAAMVLTKAKQMGFFVPDVALNKLYRFMEKALVDGKTDNMLYALSLFEAGKLNESLINTILDHNKFSSDENKLYFIMLLAQQKNKLFQNKAKTLLKSIDVTKSSLGSKLLLARLLLDNSPQNRENVVNYVREIGASKNFRYTTQIASWDLFLISQYLKGMPTQLSDEQVIVKVDDKQMELKCKNIEIASIKTGLKDKVSMHCVADKGTVYGYAVASGQVDMQHQEQLINHGIQITRFYAKQMPDGTWQNTSTFNVGDIVRITLSGTRDKNNGIFHYLVAEDYMPSAFEALNPNLPSQYFNAPYPTSYYITFSHQEFLKDRVRFFANTWMSPSFRVEYYARVVKSGEVTAPAAKMELMYDPNVYGLSIPIKMSIPAESKKDK